MLANGREKEKKEKQKFFAAFRYFGGHNFLKPIKWRLGLKYDIPGLIAGEREYEHYTFCRARRD